MSIVDTPLRYDFQAFGEELLRNARLRGLHHHPVVVPLVGDDTPEDLARMFELIIFSPKLNIRGITHPFDPSCAMLFATLPQSRMSAEAFWPRPTASSTAREWDS